MKRTILILTTLLLTVSALSIYSATGTPSNLVVRTDANNYLLVTAVTQTNPVTQGVFASRTLRTDSTGSLQVVLTGTVTPTYPLSIPASTCAAPSLGESGAATTGIAFTATPSILNCISGTARTTLTASSFTLTVPILVADGSASAPSYSFSSDPDTGFYWNAFAPNTIYISIAGSNNSRFGANGNFDFGSDAVLQWYPGNNFSGTTADVSLSREGANHLINKNSTNAQRFSVANTYTSASNNELFSVDWQTISNVALVGTRTAATGTGRPLRLVNQRDSGAGTYTIIGMDNVAPFITFAPRSTESLSTQQGITDSGNIFNFTGLHTATAGTVAWLAITPTYNQSASTASNTDLLINRTQTAVGSGTQRLIDAQVGGVSFFNVRNDGVVTGGSFILDAGGLVTFTGRGLIASPTNAHFTFRDNSGSFGIQINTGTAAPTVGTCGTGTITANSRNTAGGFTATGATACTVTFGAPAWTNTPFCTVSLRNAPTTTPYISAKSTTAITVSGLTAGDVIDYTCIGPV